MAGKPQVSHLAEFLRLVPSDDRLRMKGLIADADFKSHEGIADFGRVMIGELFGGTLSVEVFDAARSMLADIARSLSMKRAGDDAVNVSSQVIALMREQQARAALMTREGVSGALGGGAPLLIDVDPLDAASTYSRQVDPAPAGAVPLTVTVDATGRPV